MARNQLSGFKAKYVKRKGGRNQALKGYTGPKKRRDRRRDRPTMKSIVNKERGAEG